MLPDDDLIDDPIFVDRVYVIAGAFGPDDHGRVEPPAELWDRISARANDLPRIDVSPTNAPTVIGVELAPVIPMRPRSRMISRRLLAAAAVVVLVAATAAVVVVRDGSPSTQLVSSAALAPLEGTATASAKVVRVDGKLRLVLTTNNMVPPPVGQYYELWLMDRANTIPNSLGAVSGDITVTIPADLDVTKYPVVDISLEAIDSPDYSGHSVLRGTLA